MGTKTELLKILEILNNDSKKDLLDYAKQLQTNNSNKHKEKKLPEGFKHSIKIKKYIKFKRNEIYDDSIS